MSSTEHVCVCGARLRYRQDLVRESGEATRTFKCKDCLTPVPGTIAERIFHQHPS